MNTNNEIEIVNEQEYIDAAEKMYTLQQQIAELIKEKNECKNLLKKRLPDNKDTLNLGRFIFYRTTHKGNINYKDIPELEGVDLEKYRKPSQVKYHYLKKIK